MTRHPFDQVDVFCSDDPFSGNALAVVHDAAGVDDDTMHDVARWTMLSETTFLLPPADPAADYRVRILTPARELPFAGHPTLGTCRAWLASGGTPKNPDEIVQECGAGLVRIRRDGERLALAAPDFVRFGPVDPDDVTRACAALRLAPSEVVDAHWIDNGPGWLGLVLESAERVLAIEPDRAEIGDLKLGVLGPHPTGGEVDVEVRAITPRHEDPVTGSLNAGFARWLIDAGRLPETYTAAQGTVIGHAGRVFVRRDGDDTWIGGRAEIRITGEIELPA